MPSSVIQKYRINKIAAEMFLINSETAFKLIFAKSATASQNRTS